ncbi:hypothetical protein GLAREA_03051 [Glarea lozoyensis ATCC 20868]|uniref:Anaphase-promoting complex subunit 15 n=2 Tax=Glarea lozoyensis TaxID=101852 RepID=S3CKT0_GLAL2|nr:uncharacterized protein GLAREA_03051 [Glarea lozoyensis ATCC 20868]EHL00591.1 hypothetical protein M7I_3476 [Glarea lozoyensis 74030]EPE27137.1 hypothetical protein GLAREA_03051 [Glarea lozoyensis ATCC 20868]
MLSLPSLAPQDSYTLWYTSNNSPNSTQHTEPNPDHFGPNTQGQNGQPNPHRRNHGLHRHPLARLRQDEEYIERRKQNIQNYGNSWIKPPGIPKSLHQLREEKREMEEHQEALRREQLAQELAEAEASAAEGLLQGEGMDGEMDEARDLDDDVPEADTTALTYDDADETDEDEDIDNEIEDVPRGVLASRMPDDVYREALIRGEAAGDPQFGGDGDSTIDGEDGSQMLQEEDLVHDDSHLNHDEDMGMDADLDADIPEADEGYEHTDTEDELSSSEEEDESVDEGNLPQARYPAASSLVRSDGTQNSMDLSSVLSNGSSQVGSSPQQRRFGR